MLERRRLVLAFDCDDVLVPTSHALLDAYNHTYNTQVSYEHFYSDNLWGAATTEIAARRVDDLIRNGAVADIEPDPETVEQVHLIAELGHEMHVVTGRQSYQEPETHRILDTFYRGIFTTIEHTNMFATGDRLHLRRTKGEVCRILGAHMLIDDHIVHGNDVLAAGVETAVVYGDYPWNQHIQLPNGMQFCSTMKQVKDVVDERSRT